MYDYPVVYTRGQLDEIIEAHGAVDSLKARPLKRLVDLARMRADSRADGVLDDEQTDCVIGTNWTQFGADEFGKNEGFVNQWAFGILDTAASVGRDATLFTDTQIVQQDYLSSGDGRKTKLRTYTDDDYDGAADGELWIPDKCLPQRGNYIAVVEIDNELVHGNATLEEAM